MNRPIEIDRWNGNTLRRYRLPSGAVVVSGTYYGERGARVIPASSVHIAVPVSRAEAARLIRAEWADRHGSRATLAGEAQARAAGWTPGALGGWRRDAGAHDWQGEPGESFYAETVAEALAWDSMVRDGEPGA